jgi:membrane protease YdiL (CAAX protease family)
MSPYSIERFARKGKPMTLPEENDLPQPVETSIPEPPPAEPQPSLAHKIFLGPFGLRAGWSLLLYIALIAGIVFTLRTIHNHKHPKAAVTASASKASPAAKPDLSKAVPAASLITQESIVFASIFLLSWLMAFIERRKLSVFGLGGAHSARRFVTGAIWGILAISLLVATLTSFHFLHFDARLDHGFAILRWGAIQFFAFLLVGLFEEYLFRGYVQFTLTRGLVCVGNLFSTSRARNIAFWLASVVTSAIFLFAHTSNSGEDKFGLFSVFLAGMIFVVALWRTGSLWWAIGFHTTWDWGQSFLYGVPDSGGLFQGRLFATHATGNPLLSGGTVGPEGSVFLVPVVLLAIAVLIFFTRSSPQPPLEQKPQTKIAPEPSLEPHSPASVFP